MPHSLSELPECPTNKRYPPPGECCRTALRHSHDALQSKGRTNDKYKVGALEINYEKRQVHVDGAEIHLTPIEYKKVLQDEKLEAIKKKIAQVEFDY